MGDTNVKIGSGIVVPKYFWKMVCYREFQKSEPHVVLFVSENTQVPKETAAMREHALTPRSQREMDTFEPGFLNANNPWEGWDYATKRYKSKEKEKYEFALMGRYPKIDDCKKAMDLDQTQAKKWKSQFKIFNSKRRKRATDDGGAFCSQDELNELLAEDDDEGMLNEISNNFWKLSLIQN